MTRIHFKSIISRILSLHMLAIAITSVVMPAALYWLLSSTANDLHRRALGEHADIIAKYISKEQDGALRLSLPPGLRELYSENYGRYAFAVIDSSGRVLFSSLSDGAPVLRSDHRASEPIFFERQRGGALVFGASIPKRIGDQSVWVQVAQDLAHRDVLIDDIVAEFFTSVGWIAVPILLLLLLFDVLIFRRALRPVVQASETAKTIAPDRTDVRLPTADMPKEILPLVMAVNQALDRLDRGFKAQRQFTADAAHELRTPLTVLRTRIDMLPNDKARSVLQEDITNMSRMVSQLLEMAELESFMFDSPDSTDLRLACADVVSYLAPLAIEQNKSIALTGEKGAVRVRGNEEIVSRAVRNVVENAIHHTPSGTTIEVEVQKGGAVCVFDDGPGIPDNERDLIFHRFWRRDRRRKGSSGLGLSIASRIVEAYGGAISVENRPKGGATFSLQFVCEADRSETASNESEKRLHRRWLPGETAGTVSGWVSRTVVFALSCSLLFLLMQGPARAQTDDAKICASSNGEASVAACTRMINSGRPRREDLALAYYFRGQANERSDLGDVAFATMTRRSG